jgi:predicted RecB family nuclease
MLVTNEILHAFINCKYKAYRKSNNHLGKVSEYQLLYHKLKLTQKSIFDETLPKSKLFNLQFTNSNIDLVLDGIEYIGKKNIAPIFITPFEKVAKSDKLFLALQATFIQNEFNYHVVYCKVVSGTNLKQAKFKLSSFTKISSKLIAELKKTLSSTNTPMFFKNAHCQICEFKDNCLEKLIERDDLSLLAGLKPKEILQKNNRGIFSVKQLSFLFRPKKKLYSKRTFLPELKALAIRESKTLIQEMPSLKEVETEIFLDFEGIPDRNSNYLIGVIIRTTNVEKEYSFWANSKGDENAIFTQLIDLLNPINSFIIYHYGSYEIHALKNISKNLSEEYQACINEMIANSFNLLNVFTHNLYPPTYSNSLKEIAGFLKFDWTDRGATGLQSMIWRYNWEMTQDDKLQKKLIRYNIEDCRALKMVKDWVEQFQEGDCCKQLTSDYKSDNIFKWGVTNYIINDYKEVNDKAYYNYQKEHIFLRSEKKQRNQFINKTSNSRKYNQPDKRINISSDECPYCKSEKVYIIRVSKKTTIDLVFMKQGIKKQAIEYIGGTMRCGNCKKRFSIGSNDIRRVPMYGKNLLIWSVNQKIQYLQSSENIINFLKDSFKIEVSLTQMTKFKEFVAQKYLVSYKDIISDMIKSELINADETTARIKNIDGYVWVFANHDSVYYEFRETREADFLKELLKDFKGVLVSDFYTGYDFLECRQQKCLIHLIRDLNGDFLHNQLDFEFKKIVVEFGSLLKVVIASIDKYGLKKRNLKKHKKDVDKFYYTVILQQFASEIAIAYQKRFIKYREKLFCFLDYDNIPWNNNNAEHSIKPFAIWRQGKFFKCLTKENLENHLILLSVLQTCKYRGINFFEFLKSGETSISKFSTKVK